MDSKIKQSLKEFKKEIKTQALQKKKQQIRKNLPFYEGCFKDRDQDSNGTNSRSSRFPVRKDQRREQNSQVFSQDNTILQTIPQKQKQIQYLDYLRNFDKQNSNDRNLMIQIQMKQVFGENCFKNLNHLRSLVYQTLISCQNDLLDAAKNDILENMGWDFIIACYYLALNEYFEEIKKSCINLFLKFFNGWYQQKLLEQVSKHNSIQEQYEASTSLQVLQITVQEIILSRLVQIRQKNRDDELFLNITRYFSQKIHLFLKVQKRLIKKYSVEEVKQSDFSEMIFNFQFVYAIQSLYDLGTNTDISIEQQMQIFTLIGNYLTEYPQSVQNQSFNSEDFHSLVDSYINDASKLMESIINLKLHQVGEIEFLFINQNLLFLKSVLWRQINEVTEKKAINIYGDIIEIVLISNISLDIIKYSGFHTKMLQVFVQMIGHFQDSQEWFKITSFLNYLNFVFLNFHSFKLNYQNQFKDTSNENSSLKVSNTTLQPIMFLKVFQLELVLINSLFTYEFAVHSIQDESSKQFEKLQDDSKLVYSKQKDYLMNCNTSQFTYTLIFYWNVKEFFDFQAKKVKRQISNPQSETSAEKIQIQ